MDPYDLIVVGTGAGGGEAASRCANAGWRVAVIDDEPYGGTCALRGCDPKKVLVGVSDLIDWHKRMSGRGVSGDAVTASLSLIPMTNDLSILISSVGSRRKLVRDE